MERIKNYIIRIPRRLLLSKTKKREDDTYEIIDSSYISKIKDDKCILIFMYLYCSENNMGISRIFLDGMIKDFGYVPEKRKGKINDKISNILLKMEELKLIDKDENLNTSYNDYYINFFEKNDDDYRTNYITCTNLELGKLKSSNLDYLVLLKLYLYLKSRMWVRIDDYDIQVSGGKGQTCYPSYKLITEEIGLATSNIKKYLDELVRINMIRYSNCGSYYKSGNSKGAIDTPNHYVLYDENSNWELELSESLKLQKKNILDKGFLFVKKANNKSLDRSINGKKGYLKKQLNQGKITEIEYREEIFKLTNIQNGERD